MASDITLAVGDGARRMTYAELGAVRGISALSAERLVRRHKWPRQTGNDGVVRVLVPLTEARTVGGNHGVSRPGRPPLTSAPDIRGVIREVIREMSDSAPPDVRGDIREDVRADIRKDIRALKSANSALRETITTHEASIADLRERLDAAERGSATDPMTAIGMQTLSQAVEMLRQDVERERDRADRAEQQVEEGSKRNDELQATLGEERRRIDELQVSLADERRRIDGLHTDLADARTAAMISGCEAAVLRTRLDLLTERRPWWRRWFRWAE
jgi:predicted RNase H-like nuclease (RuvC/YqgF family)